MSPCALEVLKTNLTLESKAVGLVREKVTLQLVDVTGKRYPTVSLVALPQFSRQLAAVINRPAGGVTNRMDALGVLNCRAKV
jgi:hypothetical protein